MLMSFYYVLLPNNEVMTWQKTPSPSWPKIKWCQVHIIWRCGIPSVWPVHHCCRACFPWPQCRRCALALYHLMESCSCKLQSWNWKKRGDSNSFEYSFIPFNSLTQSKTYDIHPAKRLGFVYLGTHGVSDGVCFSWSSGSRFFFFLCRPCLLVNSPNVRKDLACRESKSIDLSPAVVMLNKTPSFKICFVMGGKQRWSKWSKSMPKAGNKIWANLKLQWLPMVDRHWSNLELVELFAIWSVIYINSDLSILCQTAPSAIRGNRPRWSWLCQSPCTVWVFLSHWGSWGQKPEERPKGHWAPYPVPVCP